jgi:hypothetical protein
MGVGAAKSEIMLKRKRCEPNVIGWNGQTSAFEVGENSAVMFGGFVVW